MKRKPGVATTVGTLLFIVAIAVFLKGYGDYRERQIAEKAVRQFAGGAELVWLVNRASWRRGKSSYRTLWCGRVDRENGAVAVQTESEFFPLFIRVTKVETAWTAPRVWAEDSLLYRCWTLRA